MLHLHKFFYAGFTLVESLVTLTIAATLVSLALPAFTSMRETTRLKSAAEMIRSDLKLAQSESIKRSSNVSVTFVTEGSNWCYGFSTGSSCDCTKPLSCMLSNEERRTNHASSPGITLVSNVTGDKFSFQYQRATVTAGNIELTAQNGQTIRVVVSGTGRIRMCTPKNKEEIPGYQPCV